MATNFTPTTPSELPYILKMMEDFYAIDTYPFDPDIWKKNVEHFMSNPHLGRIYTIRQDQDIAGYLVLTFIYSFEYQGLIAFVDELYILPAFQKKGIGQKTMEFIDEKSVELGLKTLLLEIEGHNERALGLYLRNGFEKNKRDLLVKKVIS